MSAMRLHGWQRANLVLAVLIGGYVVAAAFGIFVAGMLPVDRAPAVLAGNMATFAAYVAAAIWALHVQKPLRVWITLLGLSALMISAGLLLGGSPA